ncbi:hypothetical protein HHK36_024181 [Tetracentron sinense]|uniref:IAA-alanine resistance protein 1 n=1 Tax=Tetracentron sinense TaxID=13715 RepID=A0A834YP92_TETSI|nr:hypothetical protein HHK36_024181 [Tetracentron sinense]
MVILGKRILDVLILVSILVLNLDLCLGHGGNSGSCQSVAHESPAHHHCDHGHDHDHQHHHHHHHKEESLFVSKLPEELAEEEDLKLYGFGSNHGHDHDHEDAGASELSGVENDSLSGSFGLKLLHSLQAGAMLGDAFLHQLPHAFGGEHSHSHDHHVDHTHDHVHHVMPSHSHSLKDLSVGLSILFGILLFLLVEKVVRYVDDMSGSGANAWSHGHHHHHNKSNNKLKDDQDNLYSQSIDEKDGNTLEMSSKGKVLDGVSDDGSNEGKHTQGESVLRKRSTITGSRDDDKSDVDAANGSTKDVALLSEKGPAPSPSNLVFGYLNLFSDGVHNFTDGMALGSAFLLYGTVGGWSRTLFLLAHELPQEVGDFGILVRSGFSVSKALFFNFLSALVALAGTALALLWGQDPGQSSLIEGFTAGGFIYIAVAGVLPEMNNGNSTFRSSAIQLTSLVLGMAVALCISLVE